MFGCFTCFEIGAFGRWILNNLDCLHIGVDRILEKLGESFEKAHEIPNGRETVREVVAAGRSASRVLHMR